MNPLQAFVLWDETALSTGLLPTEGHREERGALLGCYLHLPSCAASLYSCLGTHNPPRCLCLFSHSLHTNCPGLFFDLGTFPWFSPCQHSCSAWQGTRISGSTPCQPLQHPQASLSPCEGQVLQVTVRSCEELI